MQNIFPGKSGDSPDLLIFFDFYLKISEFSPDFSWFLFNIGGQNQESPDKSGVVCTPGNTNNF